MLVDVDGTVFRWAYPDFGLPTEGAREALYELRSLGLRIVVWSSRLSPRTHTPEERRFMRYEIERRFERWEIPYDEVDMGDAGKRLALAYVDDRGAAFDTSHPTVEIRTSTVDRSIEGSERLAWTNVVNRIKQILKDDVGIKESRARLARGE